MHIVIADDEISIRRALQQLFQEAHQVTVCEDGDDALEALRSLSVDVLITDNQMPRMKGLELIRRGKEVSPHTSFLLMTAYGSVDQAVEAMRLGAEDYFLKPFDIDEILHRIQRIEDLRSWRITTQLKHETSRLSRPLLGVSKAIVDAKLFIEKVAQVPSPVMLFGPSGTGKEIVANAIHELGPRANRPFIAINCASLNEQLLESELFGHEKGSFTGAVSAKPGKFELAKGGTIFLDEIGELSPGIQAKLLRVLQEKEFFRLGGVSLVKTDARVIAATHRDLRAMVTKGSFREDLFFRLNVVSLELPPLAARREDIPVLLDFFWNKFVTEFGKKLVLAPETRERMLAHNYPGNVRELQNLIERIVVLAGDAGLIGPDALPSGMGKSTHAPTPPKGGGDGLRGALEVYEKQLILAAMAQHGNNQVRAAKFLKISRGALQYRLRRLGIEAPSNGDPGGETPLAA